jgi:hypothetical protein
MCGKVDGFGTIVQESLESRPTRTDLAANFAEIAVRLAGLAGWRGTTLLERTMETATARTTTRTTMDEDAD